MCSLIDNQNLPFLKYNNSQSIKKLITENMIINDILSIKIDKNMLSSNKILALYWKFHNFNLVKTGTTYLIDSFERMECRESNYFTLIVPYSNGLINKINLDPTDEQVHMYSFAEDLQSIFCYNSHEIIKESIELKIKKINDKFKINSDSSIEIVIQYEVNPDNLPNNLEILELDRFEMELKNLPLTLKKIIIDDYDEDYSVDKINKLLKIPFGCLIENKFGQEIILD